MVLTRYGPAASAASGRGQSEPGAFPKREVLILCLGMLANSYNLSSLFPYVGMMVKDLLNLETVNEAGGCNRAAPAAAAAAAAEAQKQTQAEGSIHNSAARNTIYVMNISIESITGARLSIYLSNCANRLLRRVRGERVIVRPFLQRLCLGKLDRFLRKETSDDCVAAVDGDLVSLLRAVDHVRLGPFI